MSVAQPKIKNLIMLLASAVLAAISLTGLTIYYHSPSTGQIMAGNALLSPEIALRLSFKEAGKEPGRYQFDRAEYSYYDPLKGRWQKKGLDGELYHRFYAIIVSDRSLRDVPEGLQGEFANKHAILTLYIKEEGRPEGQSLERIFQTIEFLENHYRIGLREQGGGWAYFAHPGIFARLQAISENGGLNL